VFLGLVPVAEASVLKLTLQRPSVDGCQKLTEFPSHMEPT
jgi:hypothetical protein